MYHSTIILLNCFNYIHRKFKLIVYLPQMCLRRGWRIILLSVKWIRPMKCFRYFPLKIELKICSFQMPVASKKVRWKNQSQTHTKRMYSILFRRLQVLLNFKMNTKAHSRSFSGCYQTIQVKFLLWNACKQAFFFNVV